jgi:hypothetical protein
MPFIGDNDNLFAFFSFVAFLIWDKTYENAKGQKSNDEKNPVAHDLPAPCV